MKLMFHFMQSSSTVSANNSLYYFARAQAVLKNVTLFCLYFGISAVVTTAFNKNFLWFVCLAYDYQTACDVELDQKLSKRDTIFVERQKVRTL